MPKDKFQIDMCHGPLFSKIVLFALPLMLTNILQLLFHAADLIVIGHYSNYEAMAAVGCTSSMNSFYINVFIGISVGSNVLAAKYFGAKDPENIRKTVHTSMTFALVGGIILSIVALLTAKPLLVLMGTPEKLLPKSCMYIWICFGSIPFIMLYNFGCSILRAVGDTRRPFIFLIIAGVINVILNLVLVIACKLDVEGVAIATAASHIIAASLIVRTLLKSESDIKLRLRELRIDFKTLKDMLFIGVPAGIQSSCFAISNMTIQSSINTFGEVAMAGTTAALGLEGIAYVGSNAFHFTAISFVAQNLGGQHYKRIQRSIFYCFFCAIVISTIMGWSFLWFGDTLLALYSPDPDVIKWGLLRMKILFTTYFICGLMDVSSGALRGLGYSMLSTILCLSGACFFRIFWVMCIFPLDPTMETLLISYPVSWLLVAVFSGVALVIIYRRLLRTNCPRLVYWSKLGPGVPRGFRYTGNLK